MEDKEMFSYWVTQPELLEKGDIAKLEKLTETYPYFQLAHMLLARAVSAGQPEALSRHLPKAAIHSLSRKALHRIIEDEMEWSVGLLDRLTRTKPVTMSDMPERGAPLPGEISPVVGSVPFDPTALTEFAITQQLGGGELPLLSPATPKTAIQELIDRFIKSEPAIGALTGSDTPNGGNEDLSLRNQAELEDFATESFAEILVRQGKYERAIGIYQKLILKIPEKRDYFAEKIARLK